MAETRTHGHNGWFGCTRPNCRHTPEAVGNRTRCRCEGQTQNAGKCTACNSPVLADWEWELLTDDNSAGFVEATDKEYPITITAYRGTKEVKVSGIREDSVTTKLDREGNVTLSFEFHGRPYDIGYIPCVDYYTTECD